MKDNMNKKTIVVLLVVLLAAFSVFLLTRDGGIGLGSGCGEMVDSDGNSYSTVKIGDRCWSAENIKATTDAEGNGIGRYCYADDPTNCDVYGGLYDWEVATGVCPDGWSLPGDEAWSEMEVAFGMDETESVDIGWRGSGSVGDKLKSSEHCSVAGSLDCGISGFEALPAGHRNDEGDYFAIDSFAYFWTSSESGSNAWYRYLRDNESWSYRSTDEKGRAFSVRCLKDSN